jgi:EAL domain-containing protein (putative c-di-GMP-specific phosphodiesterase class I)
MAAAEKAGDRDALTLVHVPGLPELCAQLPPAGAAALLQSIGDSIQTTGASALGQLSDSSFGALAPATHGSLNIASKVSDAIAAGGLTPPKIGETRLGLQGAGLTPEQRLLSMRYVIDRFAEKGKVDTGNGDLAGVFTGMMEETQRRLAAMTRTVGEGAFEIAYQPICELATGKVSHYEALARFSNPEGTQETVAFIEALGIANSFDLAVASKVLALVEQQPGVHIAFNVSGATIASPSSFGMLAAILAKGRKLAPRLLIEVTETAAIADLENAGKAISALRAMGYRVGLDDFGAGSASINYLHAFQVDFVKFDGAMIKKIGSSKRDDALLAGLAKLCGEMGITTIAEWIESEAMAKAAHDMGFDKGQGKWLGAPAKEFPAQPVTVGKRKGVKESWG